jgi:hypothetical protein
MFTITICQDGRNSPPFPCVADGIAGLQGIDVADVATQQLVRTLALAGQATNVAVDGAFAYTAGGLKGLPWMPPTRASQRSRSLTGFRSREI